MRWRNWYSSGMPSTGVAWETKVERRMPIGSPVWVILMVSSMSMPLLANVAFCWGQSSTDQRPHPILRAQRTRYLLAKCHLRPWVLVQNTTRPFHHHVQAPP